MRVKRGRLASQATPSTDAETRLEMASLMAQLLEDHRTTYEVIVQGLHDALVQRASLEAETDPFARRTPRYRTKPPFVEVEDAASKRAQNRVARYRVLAHALTEALGRLRHYDKAYPSG